MRYSLFWPEHASNHRKYFHFWSTSYLTHTEKPIRKVDPADPAPKNGKIMTRKKFQHLNCGVQFDSRPGDCCRSLTRRFSQLLYNPTRGHNLLRYGISGKPTSFLNYMHTLWRKHLKKYEHWVLSCHRAIFNSLSAKHGLLVLRLSWGHGWRHGEVSNLVISDKSMPYCNLIVCQLELHCT